MILICHFWGWKMNCCLLPPILVNWSTCWLDCSITQGLCFMEEVFQCNLPTVLILIPVVTDSFLLLQWLVSVRAPKSSYEVVKESATDVQVLPNHSTPQKTDSYFNPKMKLNRWESRRMHQRGGEFVMKNTCFKKQPCKTSVQGAGERSFSLENFLTNNNYTQEHYMWNSVISEVIKYFPVIIRSCLKNTQL